jgi:lipopolysaccharide export system protein LptA
MRISIQSLRRWFLVLAGLLVVGIAGTFFYARYQVRKVARDLPGKLGIDVQRTAKEFTLSKSEHGRTLFTLHASKAVEYKGGGRVLLHDFGILLYDKDGRADRITGSEFEFDPALRLATANGEVHLDLHAPQPAADATKKPTEQPDQVHEDADTLHVLAHGLMFDQTSGNASTQGDMEFHFQQAAGKARGANYDAASGRLELQSDVDVTSNTGGHNFRVRADHAAYQRDSRQLELTGAHFDSDGQTASAAHAIAELAGNGKPQTIHATGGVTFETPEHAKVTAPVADGDFDSEGRLHEIRLHGGMRSTEQQPDRTAMAEARDGLIMFDRNGMLEHVSLIGAVSIHDTQAANNHGQSPTRRGLKAERVDTSFAATKEHHSEAQRLTANGGATVHIFQTANDGRAEDSTLGGDSLTTTLLDGKSISHLEGNGHAQLSRTVAGGPAQTGSSDALAADFALSSSGQMHSVISSAVQRGNVVITQTSPPAKAGASPTVSTARAQTAEYRAGDETVTLTGDGAAAPRLNDGALDLSAQRIVFARTSGDTIATGSLKATYFAGARTPPLHIVADRGELYRAQQRAVFKGHARLWQQENSVEAPVIEMERSGGRLIAHGESDSGPAQVHSVFVSNAGAHQGTPVRVSSQRLTYSDADRLANFEGSTLVESADARVHADQAAVTLRDRAATAGAPEPKPKGEPTNSLFPGVSGAVEKIVSTGHIVLEEPGRKGTGSRLVYTANDGRFVLTGTPERPPQLTDAVRGTITGNSLIFLSRDDSVQVGDGAGGITTTRTRVQK